VICKRCSDDADGTLPPEGECGVCGREFEKLTVNGLLPYHKQKVAREVEAQPGSIYYTRVKCSGSGLAAMRGHALCNGCDCQHKPKGTLYVNPAAAASAA
jgi:hypothetical protein